MGVTIDSLEIQIQSDSASATQGLDSFIHSLEALKKSGKLTTVIKHLNNLSTAVKGFSDASRASSALGTLASAIEKLRGAGSIASHAKNLANLKTTLKSLETVNMGSVGPKIKELADALAPLSQVKAGGFGTLIRSLSKVGDVTKSLDDETIAKFAEKIAILNEKLGPFAEKMSTIKAAFGAINSNARKAAAGVKDLGEGVNTSTLNLSSFIEIARTAVQTIQELVRRFSEFVKQAIEWDGISARFGRGFGAQAQETYEWIQRLNEELGINIQQFMQYASVSANMLTGFGVSHEDATKMALGYTELTYDIWAGYNDIYKTFDDAAEAVRSAIAGEVEPIRRAGFTIIESTLQQTAANHGLEISIEKATEAQKSYLRYLTLVDQAHSQSLIGTYAKELNTAEGLTRTLAQQLKSLSQAFGSLFLPILVRVMPWIQAFVELLTEAVYWTANLFGIDIQPVDFSGYEVGAGAIEDVANSAGGAADKLDDATKAAKELKNATLGIDELNVISPSSSAAAGDGAGGAGGAGSDGFAGLDIDSLWDESIFDSVQSKVDEIKGKLKGMFDDWLPTLQVIGAALGAWTIASLLEQLGEALQIADKFEGAVKNIKKLASTAIIVALQFKLMGDAFSDFMGEDGTILDYLEGVLIGAASSFLLYKMWGPGGLAIGLGVSAVVSLKTVFEEGGITDMESGIVALTGLASAIGAVAAAIGPLTKAWEAIKASKFIGDLGAFISLAKEHGFISSLAAAFPKLSGAITGVASALGGISAPVWAGIAAAVAAVASMAYFLYENWDKVTEAFKNFFDENIAPKLEEIGSHFEKIKEVLGPLWTDVLDPIFKGISDFFSDIDWDSVIKGLGTAFEWLGGIIFALVSGSIMGLINAIASILAGVVQAATGIIETVSGVIDIIVGIFTLDGEKIIGGAEKIISGVGDVFGGLWDATVGAVVEFFDGVVGWFTDLWDELVGHSIVPDTIDGIVESFTSLPGKVFGSVGDFVTGIVDKFKNLGDSLSKKFSSAWNTVKSWWDKKSNLKSYTPSIGSIKDKLSSAWTSAKNWWSKSKAKLSTYTPSIGSIKDKLSSAWTTAKNWWNKSKAKLSTYTPSIGNIKDKLKSAWNTAKSWWNKNVKLSIPSLKFKVTYSEPSSKTMKAIMKALNLPGWPKLSFAANGGIFDTGSLIWAGERGPEVMATAAGGKTGVMNVQQMQDAVYEGVFAAVSAAMRGNGNSGGQDVHVYLDGREITAAVERRQRERGASLMGNEVYAY